MNTVLSPAMVKKALTYKDDLHQEICPQCIEHLIKAQDSRTKSILADEVRKMVNPYENVRSTGFEHCRNTVLKLLEAKE